MSKQKPLIPTAHLIKRLHLMADVGGMLTRDRLEAVRQAADRLEQFDERLSIMTEMENKDNIGFNVFHDMTHVEVTSDESQ